MKTYDYLVRQIDNLGKEIVKGKPFEGISPIFRDTINEKYVRDAISAEDAVREFAGESVLNTEACGGMFFFEGLSTGTKYVAIQIRKVYIIYLNKDKDHKLIDIRSDKRTIQKFMEQFPDEENFSEIEERIIDDPSTLTVGVPDDQSIFTVIFDSTLTKILYGKKIKKDLFSILSLNKIKKDCVTGNYCVFVAAKENLEAIERAKTLCKQYKETENEKQ